MKRKLLIGITALSVMGMVACGPSLDAAVESDDLQISVELETDDIESEFTEEGNVAKYENCTNLRLPSEMENLNLIGKIALISDDGMLLTTDNVLRDGYGTYDNIMFQASDDFMDFYLTNDLDVIAINTDGSYSYYPYYREGTEYRFRIDEGEIIECGKLTSNDLYALVKIEDKIIGYIIEHETGAIIETIDNFKIKDISGDEISAEFEQLLYHPGTTILYVTDSDGNLRGSNSWAEINFLDDEKSVDLYMPEIYATNIDRLLGSDSQCNVAYSKTDDLNHIYILGDLNYNTMEFEELVYDLPDGYTTADIDNSFNVKLPLFYTYLFSWLFSTPSYPAPYD